MSMGLAGILFATAAMKEVEILKTNWRKKNYSFYVDKLILKKIYMAISYIYQILIVVYNLKRQ